MSDGDDNPPPARTSAVALKLPDFWVDKPRLWFSRVEAQFRLHRPPIVVSSTMFDHVVTKLPPHVLDSVEDAVENPSADTPYEDIKKLLLSSFTPTKWQLVDELLNFPAIGDRRPLALYTAMAAKLPRGETPGLLFQGLFLARLPGDVRAHLVAGEYKNPREMAEHADRLWDGARAALVAAARAPGDDDDDDDYPAAAGVTKVSSRPRSPSSQPRRRAPTPGPAPGSSSSQRSSQCWYHARFGSDAQKCEPPCSFQGNRRAGGRRRN